AWVMPGHADRCVTAHLGYGRTMAGRVAADTGFDAYPLRTTREIWSASLRSHKVDGHRTLVTTQEHDDTAKRDLVRHATLAEFAAHPHFAHEAAEAPGQELSLYPPVEYKGRQWGLAVDLGSGNRRNDLVEGGQREDDLSDRGRRPDARRR